MHIHTFMFAIEPKMLTKLFTSAKFKKKNVSSRLSHIGRSKIIKLDKLAYYELPHLNLCSLQILLFSFLVLTLLHSEWPKLSECHRVKE